jgi:MFS family permease
MSSNSRPQWLTFSPRFGPICFLIVLALSMLLIWLDPGTFPSGQVQGSYPSGNTTGTPGITPQLNLSYTEFSLLSTIYTIGLMFGSLVWALLSSWVSEFKLMGLGMVVFGLGEIGTALSQTWAAMMVARAVVGLGASSIMIFTFPFLDDIAPLKWAALWFAIVSLTQPLGVALGYIAIGSIASASSWPIAFYTLAAFTAPFIAFFLFAPPLILVGSEEQGQEEDKEVSQGISTWHRLFSSLRSEAVRIRDVMVYYAWNLNNIGYIPVEFLIIVVTWWAPTVAKQLYPSMSADDIGFALGAAAVVAGIVGSLLGGLSIAFLGKTFPRAFAIALVFSLIAPVCFILAYTSGSSFERLVSLGGLGILFLAALNPINYLLSCRSVPPHLRSMSQALILFFQRLGGDLPGPPLTGAIQGATNNWSVTIPVITSVMIISIIAYGIGALTTHSSPQFKDEERAGGGGTDLVVESSLGLSADSHSVTLSEHPGILEERYDHD